MLSIDEAIEKYRDIANPHDNCWLDCRRKPCGECEQEHEQIAEWLEELKAYREVGTVEECRNSVLDIPKAYNKAIDDFKQKLLKKAPRNYAGELELGGSVCFLSANSVTKISEQLKAGGKNV